MKTIPESINQNKTAETYASLNSDFFTPRELARKLNMSLKWVIKQTQQRRIKGQQKFGHSWRYRKIDVEKRLLGNTQFLLDTRGKK